MPSVCGLARRSAREYATEMYNEAAKAGTKLKRQLTAIINKPLELGANAGPRFQQVRARVFAYTQAQQAWAGDAAELWGEMKAVGFGGPLHSREAAAAAWTLSDLIPARVLGGLYMRGRHRRPDGAALLAEALQEIERVRSRPLFGMYDERYLNPDRLRENAEVIKQALDALSDTQLRTLAKLARRLRHTRALSLRSKRYSLMMEQRLAKGTVDFAERNRKLRDQTGLTITSYITHFYYDALRSGEGVDLIWRSGLFTDFEEIGIGIDRILREMPDDLADERRVEWFAEQVGRLLAGEDADDAAVRAMTEAFREYAAPVMADAMSGKSPSLAAIAQHLPRRVFVPYLRRRMRRDFGELVANPFQDFPRFMGVMGRQIFIEPAVAYGRVHRFLLPDEAERKQWDIFLNTLIGTPVPRGIEAYLNAVPGGRQTTQLIESAVLRTIYFKLLWANTSSALVNSTHLLQWGTGRQGAQHGANAFRMLMGQDDNFFFKMLAEMHITEHSFSGAFGVARGGRFDESFNPLTQSWKDARAGLGETLEQLRGARSRNEALQLSRQLVIGLRGGSRTALRMLDFMGQSERAMRYYTAAAGMSRSATEQLLERLPDAKITYRRGNETGLFVRDAFGNVFDPLEEIRKTVVRKRGGQRDPLTAAGERAFRFGGSVEPQRELERLSDADLVRELSERGELLNLARLEDDTTFQTLDTLFVLSSANYSALERTIRSAVPIVGPAAGVFMNYSLHAAGKIASHMSSLVRWANQNTMRRMLGGGLTGEAAAALNREAAQASRALTRFSIGTMLVGGPYAFAPIVDAALQLGNAIGLDVPESIDESPEFKAVLDQIERYSLAGLLGVDYSQRVGIFSAMGDALSFFAGGRFAANPLSETLGSIVTAGGLKSATPEDRARARYRLFGSFAKLFDPAQEYGHNPIGRDFPLLPIMLHNLAQLGVDAYDAAHGDQFLVDELGQSLEPVPPWHVLARRGLIGRTIYDREKMAAIAESRPQLNAELTHVRQQWIDTMLNVDLEAGRRVSALERINERYHDLSPIRGMSPDTVHPDLRVETSDVTRWFLRHATSNEFRQLRHMQRGVGRVELDRSLGFLETQGYAADGQPNVTALETDIFRQPPHTWSQRELLIARAWWNVLAVLSRPSGQEALAQLSAANRSPGQPQSAAQGATRAR